MPKIKSPVVDLCRRLIKPIIETRTLFRCPYRYTQFFLDLLKFRKATKSASVRFLDLYPCLYDKSSTTGYDVHYTYLNAWAMRRIYSNRPSKHIDIGSQISFVTQLSAIIPVEFVDIRPVVISLENLSSKHGTILSLPYDNCSVESISSLHVIEHIGLGRYGDLINPDGSKQAIAELCRILRPGGHVYLGVPVGIERVCFNAHRVLSSATIVEWFRSNGCSLTAFSYVDDRGIFHSDAQPLDCSDENFGCGMFVFSRS